MPFLLSGSVTLSPCFCRLLSGLLQGWYGAWYIRLALVIIIWPCFEIWYFSFVCSDALIYVLCLHCYTNGFHDYHSDKLPTIQARAQLNTTRPSMPHFYFYFLFSLQLSLAATSPIRIFSILWQSFHASFQ